MTFAGFIELDDELSKVNLTADQSVNPFLYMRLKQIDFSAVLVEHNQIFLPSFGKHIILMPSNPATHLPGSLYAYLENNFFRKICHDGGYHTISHNDKHNFTSFKMEQCRCTGTDFYGMPALEF